MNTLKKILAVVILMQVFQSNRAQLTDLNSSSHSEAPLIGRNYVAPPKGKGSPYLYDNWLKGYVVFHSGDTVKNKLFKFDCLKNDFVWMADGKSMVALDHSLIRSFTLLPENSSTGRKFVKSTLKIPFISDTLVRYLEVLAEGKFNLYAFRRVSVTAEPVTGVSGGLYQVNSYESEPVYFIQTGNLPARQVKFSKKSLREAYPEYSANIRQLLRSGYYGGIRNEYQLSKAVEVINDGWK